MQPADTRDASANEGALCQQRGDCEREKDGPMQTRERLQYEERNRQLQIATASVTKVGT